LPADINGRATWHETIIQMVIMNKYSTNMLVFKSVLSYPSSLEEQAMNMPNLLQETRIGKYGLWQAKDFVGAIQKVFKSAVLSYVRNGVVK